MATNKDVTKRTVQHILNTQLDDSVEPNRVVIGVAGKDPNGGYTPIKVDINGGVVVGSSGASGGQVDAHPVTSAGATLVDTQGGQTYEKVGIVADGDKYVRGIVAHDASASSIEPIVAGGVASAAAPTDVSADGDAVNAWLLRNGARAVQTTHNGTLVNPAAPVIATGTNVIGQVVAAQQADVIYIGTTSYAVSSVKVDRATSGELIASVSSKKIRVISGWLTVAADTTLRFDSHTAGALTGAATVKGGGGFVWPRNPDGIFGDTTAGEALDVTMGTGVQVSGRLYYITI